MPDRKPCRLLFGPADGIPFAAGPGDVLTWRWQNVGYVYKWDDDYETLAFLGEEEADEYAFAEFERGFRALAAGVAV